MFLTLEQIPKFWKRTESICTDRKVSLKPVIYALQTGVNSRWILGQCARRDQPVHARTEQRQTPTETGARVILKALSFPFFPIKAADLTRRHRLKPDLCACFRSASPRLVLQQPRATSPFQGASGSTKSAGDTGETSALKANSDPTVSGGGKAANALIQRDYLKQIASPKMVSPTRLRKFGSQNRPGSADSTEVSHLRKDS